MKYNMHYMYFYELLNEDGKPITRVVFYTECCAKKWMQRNEPEALYTIVKRTRSYKLPAIDMHWTK